MPGACTSSVVGTSSDPSPCVFQLKESHVLFLASSRFPYAHRSSHAGAVSSTTQVASTTRARPMRSGLPCPTPPCSSTPHATSSRTSRSSSHTIPLPTKRPRPSHSSADARCAQTTTRPSLCRPRCPSSMGTPRVPSHRRSSASLHSSRQCCASAAAPTTSRLSSRYVVRSVCAVLLLYARMRG